MTATQPETNTPRNNVKALRILCTGIIAGCVVFALMISGLALANVIQPVISPGMMPVFLGILACTGLICLFLAFRTYNNSITSAKDSLILLPEKLNIYRLALIKYMALCEGPALFGIIVFFISGNYLALIVTGVMLIAMLAKFPTLDRVISELGLGSQERQELE